MRKLLSSVFIAGFIFSPQFASAAKSETSALHCGMMRPIVQSFFAQHVTGRSLEMEIEGRTIEQFLKRLDPSKVYLLDSEAAQVRSMLRGSFKKLGEDCTPIEKVHAYYAERVKQSADFVKKTLSSDQFKFAENTELVIDPNQRIFQKTKPALEAEQLKFIQFQISNYLASDMKLAEAKKHLIHRYELIAKRQSEFKKDELYALYLDTIANSLDAHSSYMSKDVLEDFEIGMKLSLEGIGAALSWEDGYTTVDNLIPGGSAEKSGDIKPKDKILAVAQGDGEFEQVIDMPLRDVVKLIRGKKGTKVRLSILRQGAKETERLIVSLVRDKIKLEDEAAKLRFTNRKMGEKTYKIAVLDLPSFYGDMGRSVLASGRSCYADMKKAVEQAVKEKADGLVIDLSKNGGGLLTEAVRIAGLFIDQGNVVATKNAQGQLEVLADEDSGVQFKGPIVVLTSRLSASASEIVSGALQDYRRAVIVGGDQTFGKGTVQAMIPLPADLGAIKVTTGMFFIPGGTSTQYRGVPADITLPSVFSTKEIGEIALDYSLKPQKVSSFLTPEANSDDPKKHWVPIDDAIVAKLKKASSSRIEKDPEFKKIQSELADLEKKKGTIKLADSLKKQKEEKADPKKKTSLGGRKAKRATDEEYLNLPQVKEAIAVMSDLITIESEKTSKTTAKN